jgi:NADPH:quinone reductase-like Zn-dependent oxidoreductase
MNTDGGFGQFIRVPDDWAVKLPENLTLKEAMTLGTAGLTAGMAVLRLTEIIEPKEGEIIISGATGGWAY